MIIAEAIPAAATFLAASLQHRKAEEESAAKALSIKTNAKDKKTARKAAAVQAAAGGAAPTTEDSVDSGVAASGTSSTAQRGTHQQTKGTVTTTQTFSRPVDATQEEGTAAQSAADAQADRQPGPLDATPTGGNAAVGASAAAAPAPAGAAINPKDVFKAIGKSKGKRKDNSSQDHSDAPAPGGTTRAIEDKEMAVQRAAQTTNSLL